MGNRDNEDKKASVIQAATAPTKTAHASLSSTTTLDRRSSDCLGGTSSKHISADLTEGRRRTISVSTPTLFSCLPTILPQHGSTPPISPTAFSGMHIMPLKMPSPFPSRERAPPPQPSQSSSVVAPNRIIALSVSASPQRPASSSLVPNSSKTTSPGHTTLFPPTSPSKITSMAAPNSSATPKPALVTTYDHRPISIAFPGQPQTASRPILNPSAQVNGNQNPHGLAPRPSAPLYSGLGGAPRFPAGIPSVAPTIAGTTGPQSPVNNLKAPTNSSPSLTLASRSGPSSRPQLSIMEIQRILLTLKGQPREIIAVHLTNADIQRYLTSVKEMTPASSTGPTQNSTSGSRPGLIAGSGTSAGSAVQPAKRSHHARKAVSKGSSLKQNGTNESDTAQLPEAGSPSAPVKPKRIYPPRKPKILIYGPAEEDGTPPFRPEGMVEPTVKVKKRKATNADGEQEEILIYGPNEEDGTLPFRPEGIESQAVKSKRPKKAKSAKGAVVAGEREEILVYGPKEEDGTPPFRPEGIDGPAVKSVKPKKAGSAKRGVADDGREEILIYGPYEENGTAPFRPEGIEHPNVKATKSKKAGSAKRGAADGGREEILIYGPHEENGTTPFRPEGIDHPTIKASKSKRAATITNSSGETKGAGEDEPPKKKKKKSEKKKMEAVVEGQGDTGQDLNNTGVVGEESAAQVVDGGPPSAKKGKGTKRKKDAEDSIEAGDGGIGRDAGSSAANKTKKLSNKKKAITQGDTVEASSPVLAKSIAEPSNPDVNIQPKKKIVDQPGSMVLGRAKRSTAGNRMRALLERAHALEEEEGFEEVADDDDFVAMEEEDIFEEDFESTDEEGEYREDGDVDLPPGVTAEARDTERNEVALRKEEKKARKAEKSKRYHDPLAYIKTAKKAQTLQIKERRVSFATPGSESGSSDEDEDDQESTATPRSHLVERNRRREEKGSERRQSMRASTLLYKQESDARVQGRKAKKSTGSARWHRKAHVMTQADYIAAALDEEDKNTASLQDWLAKEEERKKHSRLDRKVVMGPKMTWISRTIVTENEDKEEENLTKMIRKKFKLDRLEGEDEKRSPTPVMYTRNVILLSDIPGGKSEEKTLLFGDHYDWTQPIVRPQRKKSGLRRPVLCAVTDDVAKYRSPGLMIPYCKLECYRKITDALGKGLVWNEGTRTFEEPESDPEPEMEPEPQAEVEMEMEPGMEAKMVPVIQQEVQPEVDQEVQPMIEVEVQVQPDVRLPSAVGVPPEVEVQPETLGTEPKANLVVEPEVRFEMEEVEVEVVGRKDPEQEPGKQVDAQEEPKEVKEA